MKNKVLQVECLKFLNVDIFETTNSVNTEFENQLLNNKKTFWVVWHYKI